MIPKKLYKYLNRWDPKKTNLLLLYKSNNHHIDLVENIKSPARKIYDLSKDQAAVVKEYKKKIKIYIDYRILNVFTIKNHNTPPLIREIFSRLYKIKYYSKFDVIAAFNKIKIKKKDKEKTVFLIRYGFF